MHIERVADFRCPRSGSPLQLIDAVVQAADVVAGRLVSAEGASYPIEQGVPNFVDTASLVQAKADVQAQYDRVAREIYDTAVDWQFAAHYEDEDAVREGMVDLLGLTPGSNVLDVGCGTGRDAFRLARRLGGDGRLHMQDLSSAMVHACARKMSGLAGHAGCACALDYSVSDATGLPFPAGIFDAVFHFGGFNQFGDLRQAAAELTRVAKPGGRILLGDEGVAPWLRGTEFDAIVTTNNPLFTCAVPLDVLPASARDVTVRWVIGNCFYVMSFRKGDGPPPLNLDLPHQGWRGGTMRTRYFGVLEGVTVEARALAKEAAAKSGMSVHEWLDQLVKAKASGKS